MNYGDNNSGRREDIISSKALIVTLGQSQYALAAAYFESSRVVMAVISPCGISLSLFPCAVITQSCSPHDRVVPCAMAVILFILMVTIISYSPAITADLAGDTHSPYRSLVTFRPDFNQMLTDFKIFVYDQSRQTPTSTSSPLESLFHAHLLNSPFLTSDPELAHLFYLALPDRRNTRSIARSIRDLRNSSPFWNRTLGADHFFLLCDGLGVESDRNLVELKKNSIQVSCFPPADGKFIPHKDLTLPPPFPPNLPSAPTETTRRLPKNLGYFFGDETGHESVSLLLNELRKDPSFLIESRPSDPEEFAEKLSSSRFCLFFYGTGEFPVGEALRFGCVPVVVADRPIVGLPFADVLRWAEMPMFVRMGEAQEVKRALERACGEGYDRMRELGMRASVHFQWGEVSESGYDVFRTVVYQLWTRRHVIRYASWKVLPHASDE